MPKTINPFIKTAPLDLASNMCEAKPNQDQFMKEAFSILDEGIKNHYSKEYVTDQIFELGQKCPELILENPDFKDYSSIKQTVKNYYEQHGNNGKKSRTKAKVYDCQKPLSLLKWYDKSGRKTGTEAEWNPFYHEYLCVENSNGRKICGGQSFDISKKTIIGYAGKPSNDQYRETQCEPMPQTQEDQCIHDCIKKEISKKERPFYSVAGLGTNCQEYVQTTIEECQTSCNPKKTKF